MISQPISLLQKLLSNNPSTFRLALTLNTSASIKRFISLFFIILICCTSVFSQTGDKKNLQTKYEKLQDEIKDAEDLLNSTKKKKENSLDELKLLNRKITVRQEAIRNIAQQVSGVNNQLKEANTSIDAMENDMGELKKQYAQMVYYTYLNDENFKPLHFIFSAKSINDAFQRMQYIRSFHSFRKDQITAIEEISVDLKNKREIIESEKGKKEELLTKEEQQKQKLDEEKTSQDKTVKSLQSKEADIKKQIAKKKKDAQVLNNKIQAVIAEEIKKEKEKAAAAEAARLKALEKNKPVTETKTTTPVTEKKTVTETKSTNLNLTPEMALISKNFEGNKGKLPWPVERGTITERFGKHPHPVLKDVIIENNGINIATAEGSAVRAIFDGEVVNIIFNPAFQKGVIIKHGEYYSVYTNISEVTVKAGDKITTKQKIGTAWEDPEEGKTEVHLEIWKNTVILDPSLWISK